MIDNGYSLGTVLHLIYLKLMSSISFILASLGTVLHLIYLKQRVLSRMVILRLGTVLHLIYLKHIIKVLSHMITFGYCVTFDISQTHHHLYSVQKGLGTVLHLIYLKR